jgi:hypothetical protein
MTKLARHQIEPFRVAGLTAPVFHISDILVGDISESRVYAEPVHTVLLFALRYPFFFFFLSQALCATHTQHACQKTGVGGG